MCRLARMIAVIVVLFAVPSMGQQSPTGRLTMKDIQGLQRGGVPEDRVGDIIKKRGIAFVPPTWGNTPECQAFIEALCGKGRVCNLQNYIYQAYSKQEADLASQLESQGKFAEAESAYRETARVSFNSFDALMGLATVLRKQGKEAEGNRAEAEAYTARSNFRTTTEEKIADLRRAQPFRKLSCENACGSCLRGLAESGTGMPVDGV